MSVLNMVLRLVAFREANTSSPQLNHFKWTREIVNVPVNDPVSIDYTLEPGEQIELFNSLRPISHAAATEYSISNHSGGVYKIKWTTTGPNPSFRTTRAIGVDNTTQVSLSVDPNTKIVTLTTPAGTPMTTTPVVVGDIVYLSDTDFTPNNAGAFTVLAKDATSITFRNPSATNQTVTLGTNFNDKFKVFSIAGVKKGDRVLLKHSVNTIFNGVYEIVDVLDDTLFIYSKNALPPVTDTNWDLSVFSSGKQLVYLESDKPLSIQVNNVWESDLEIFGGKSTQPGVYLKKSLVYRLVIRNNSDTDAAKVFFASAE